MWLMDTCSQWGGGGGGGIKWSIPEESLPKTGRLIPAMNGGTIHMSLTESEIVLSTKDQSIAFILTHWGRE